MTSQNHGGAQHGGQTNTDGLNAPSLDVKVPSRIQSVLERVALDRVDDDSTFRVRAEGDLSALATDLARLGQLIPVDVRLQPPNRYQPICGFRRLAALRFLKREAVWARVHFHLSDEDALLLALASAIHARPVSKEEIAAFKDRLASEDRLSPVASEMLNKALEEPSPLPAESAEEDDQEVDTDRLAEKAIIRLGELNQDLSRIREMFNSLDGRCRDELLKRLADVADMFAYLNMLNFLRKL